MPQKFGLEVKAEKQFGKTIRLMKSILLIIIFMSW